MQSEWPFDAPPNSDSPAGGNIAEFSVSELSAALKRTVEDTYGHVRVRGELGRVSRPGSGHVYLDLKDDKAVLAGVMWKGVAQRLSDPARAGPGSGGDGQTYHLSGPVEIPDRHRGDGAGRRRRADGAARGAQEEARRRRAVRRGPQEGAALSAGRHRCRDLAHRRRHPRHPAPAWRPFPDPGRGLAGPGPGREMCRTKWPPASGASTRSNRAATFPGRTCLSSRAAAAAWRISGASTRKSWRARRPKARSR